MVELPVTWPANRRKMAWVLALSIAMTAGGIAMIVKGEDIVIAWLCTILFGLGVVAGAISLHPRASWLRLTEQGFECCSLFRRHSTAWADVLDFVPISMNRNSFVGFFYDPARKNPAMRKVSGFISGVEGMLPDTYGHTNIELARIMNELRARYAPRR